MCDQPRPSGFYVVLLMVLMFVGAGTCVGVVVEMQSNSVLVLVGIVMLFALPMTALTLLPLHAAFRTRYLIEDGVVTLRAGVVIRATLQCADVRDVTHVPFIPRVLGWGGGRGLANRFTNGIMITMNSDAVYYLSPSKPSEFLEALRDAMGQCAGP